MFQSYFFIVFLASRPGMKVILIPSTRDMITDFTVFPQPPLGSGLTAQQTRARKRALGLNQQGDQTDGNILTFPNPVFFAMNEIVIGVSTQDILLHLGGKEVSKNLGGGSLSQASSSQPSSSQPTPTKPSSSTTTTAPVPENRIVRLFRHLVEQRSFYPMHPPGLSDTHIEYAQLYTSNNDTTTSTSNNDKNFEFKVTPDILIVPSALRFSAGIIHQKDGGSGCVCVNPGKLVIGSSGGTFVSMCIHLLDMEELEGKCRLDAADGGDVDEFYLQHSVGDRVRVDIVRI